MVLPLERCLAEYLLSTVITFQNMDMKKGDRIKSHKSCKKLVWYHFRVRSADAIRYVRLKRPGAVQTRRQIECVKEFESYFLPQCLVFSHKPAGTAKVVQPQRLFCRCNLDHIVYKFQVFLRAKSS